MTKIKLPKLYLNENVPVRLVDILAKSGISAIHTIQANNRGVTDEFQLQYAADRSYVVVTHNRRDFRLIHKRWLEEGKSHAGILVMGHGEPEKLADRIKRFFEQNYHKVSSSFCETPPP